MLAQATYEILRRMRSGRVRGMARAKLLQRRQEVHGVFTPEHPDDLLAADDRQLKWGFLTPSFLETTTLAD